MDEIKFTVVIPTRERSDVLASAIKTVVAQNYNNFELIVSDNFSNDDTRNVVKSFPQKNIRYINTGKRLGMSQNWEFALSHITDGWVTIIGDDDGLLPNALSRAAKIIHKTGTKAIRSTACGYEWPNEKNGFSGRLGVPLKTGWKKRSSSEWLARVMMMKNDITHLPMLYNGGFVDYNVLNAIKKKSGAFFKSMTPDYYMAIAIASMVPDYIYSFEPLVISGASKHSGGGCAFSRKEKDKNSPSVKFFQEPNIPFHNALPLDSSGYPVVSIQAIIYEAYLQSESLRDYSQFINHQQQLALILASSLDFKASVENWGKKFAQQHELDLQRAKKEACIIGRKYKFSHRLQQINTIVNSYGLGDKSYPLKNVYDASIAGGSVQTIKPNLWSNILRIIKRVKKQ